MLKSKIHLIYNTIISTFLNIFAVVRENWIFVVPVFASSSLRFAHRQKKLYLKFYVAARKTPGRHKSGKHLGEMTKFIYRIGMTEKSPQSFRN